MLLAWTRRATTWSAFRDQSVDALPMNGPSAEDQRVEKDAGRDSSIPFDAEAPLLVWIGRFSSHDGYGTAARAYARALRDAGAPLLAIDIASGEPVGSYPEQRVRLSRNSEGVTVEAVTSTTSFAVVVHERPDRYPWVTVGGRSQMIGLSYAEADGIPAGWSTAMASMDRLWSSSTFLDGVFQRAGVPSWMIERVDHPLDPLAVEVGRSRSRLRTRWAESTVFMSLVSSSVGSTRAGRRDLGLLFEAYSLAFTNDDDVALVLKSPASGAESVRDEILLSMLAQPARASGSWPTVYTIAADLTREQLMRLHASVDCYVSCERGNGWDLPAMDSTAMGIPVVAPAFGASTTFIQPEDSYVVPVSTALVDCDGAFGGHHPLYAGQYWPYVDPSALAEALRMAHDMPDDRRHRGAAVAARVRRDHDGDRVGRAIIRLLSELQATDVRATTTARVTVASKQAIWDRADGLPPFGGNSDLRHATLLELLGRPDFARPRDPRRFVEAYKLASGFVLSERGLLPASSARRAVELAMAVPARRVLAKARAIISLRRIARREVERAGGYARLRDLSNFADDYRRSVASGRSRYSAEDAERVRRPGWVRYGPFRSPDDDLERLAELRNRYIGERIFVMGNGPSLLKCDLSKLAGEYTFGVNKIHLLFDKIDWRPSFYTLLDWKMGAAMKDEIDALGDVLRFFPERFRGVLPPGDNTYWYWTRPVGDHIDDQFESNITKGIPSRATVLVTAIQQAFYLGFREIILVGVDAQYVIPTSVVQSGPDVFGTGTRLHLESTADDDPNHFAPNYFGTGARWHDPNVADMHRMFRLMRKGVERHGGRLLNATVGGNLEVLERVRYEDLF